MIFRSCLLPLLFFNSLFQPVFLTGNLNCSVIERQLAAHIGNRVIANRRFDKNVCAGTHGSVSNTCCSREMLHGMAETSKHEVKRSLKKYLEIVSENFRNDTIALKSFVIDTLGTTMERLHYQLRNDLSYRFRAHEQFLINFFSTLQSYLSGNVDGLPRLMASFFDQLLLKVTQLLLNTNATDAYTKCVIDELKSMQPFLRIPDIITNMTMEAFPPIRTAINSMAFARETLLAASITLHPPQECFDDYQRLRFCSLCAGIISANSCKASCDRLAQTCVPQHLALGTQWKKFITALQEVMNLLDKFPKVHRPLQMHLTDAIMNLKSVYTRYEQEISSNCSSPLSYSSQSRITTISTSNGGHWSRSGHLRARRQASSPYYPPPVVYQQPPFALETRPLTVMAAGEQAIARLQAWVRDVNFRYNEVAHLFDNMGLEMCNSQTAKPLFANTVIPSGTCWNGTSLVPSMTRKSDIHRGQLEMLTDPTLLQKELGLRKAMSSLQLVARSMLVDPEILQLADPAATILKAGRNGLPVNSDEEALRSYLALSASTADRSNSPEVAAAPSGWGDVSGGMDLESDIEADAEGSGYGFDELPPTNSDPLVSLPRSNLNGLPLESISHPLPTVNIPSTQSTSTIRGHSPLPISNNFAPREGDEDFPSHIENSGYEPLSPFDMSSGMPPNDWDAEPDLPEESSDIEPLVTPFDLEPTVEWAGSPPSSSSQSSVQAGDSGLVIGEGKMKIPDQIWVPESDEIVQQYPSPSHTLITTGVSTLAFSPVLSFFLPITVSIMTLANSRR